jgi:hypothetical protein
VYLCPHRLYNNSDINGYKYGIGLDSVLFIRYQNGSDISLPDDLGRGEINQPTHPSGRLEHQNLFSQAVEGCVSGSYLHRSIPNNTHGDNAMNAERFYAYTFDNCPEGKIFMEPASPGTIRVRLWDTIDQLHTDLAGQTYRIYSTHRVLDYTIHRTSLEKVA